MKPVSTGKKQAATLFKPGQTGNPAGRPKGSKNKLGEDFIAALAADFEAHGVAVVQTVRQEKPEQYLKVIASILPKEFEIRRTTLDGLTDDELAAGLETLRALVAGGVGAGDAQAASQGKPDPVH
jgi:hypothetical protein